MCLVTNPIVMSVFAVDGTYLLQRMFQCSLVFWVLNDSEEAGVFNQTALKRLLYLLLRMVDELLITDESQPNSSKSRQSVNISRKNEDS